MDNITKYKLSNYTDIKPLDGENKVFLCYDNINDRVCVKKHRDIASVKIYKKLKALDNELLPKVYDIIIWDEEIVVIEEYIKGRSIEEIVEEKALPRNVVIKYSLDIAEALISIHSEGIIHRDISPDNIIIDENDRARLLDFDIARIGNNKSDKNMDTAILGTAGFASPEQFGFAKTDTRSDIFSLGELMNYMLTGCIIQNKMTDDIYIAPIVEKATKFNPSQRYGSVEELKEMLYLIYTKNLNITEKFAKEKKLFLKILRKIPGFRTGSPIRAVIASAVYLIYFTAIGDFISGGWSFLEFVDFSLAVFAMFILPMWWFGNNGKNWDIIWFIKFKNKDARLAAAIAVYVIMLLAFIALSCIIKPPA